MITPNDEKKFERDPEEGNFPTGVYTCELSRSQETGPGAKYPGGNNRILFEFTVIGGQYGGKKAIVLLGKTLHKSKDGRESNLVKWARMMGVANPESGFDPESLVGKRFQVTCEYTAGTNGQPGRAWARMAIATPQQSGAAPAPHPHTTVSGADATGGQLWDYSDGKKGPNTKSNQTTEQVIEFLDYLAGETVVPVIRIRRSGSNEAPVAADVWLSAHAPSTVPDDGDIPF